MKESRLKLIYKISDLLFSMAAWLLFFFFRKIAIEQQIFGEYLMISADRNMYAGMVIIPLYWFIIYYTYGYYNNPLRKSRLKELGVTFFATLFGTVFLFFILILDDQIAEYKSYYLSFAALFSFQFFLVYIPRFILSTRTSRLIQSGQIGFNTIIIGGNGKASDIYNKIKGQTKSTGNIFVGFISITGSDIPGFEMQLPRLGSLNELSQVIVSHNIKEVIIAVEPSETEITGFIINMLGQFDILIKSVPGTHDILLGRVKMSTIFGTPLIILHDSPMPTWQYNLKMLIDFLGSIAAIIITLPVSMVIIAAIRLESKGGVIFKQERVGKNGKPFYIYKFRSMIDGAEGEIPMLSSDEDQRVTRVGRFMRRHRLDEIPNFINVVKGDMSIVGPRPERRYFIDMIVNRAPEYQHLLRIKPGITSWGQVMYGYASDVDQMVKRLEYDLLYIENMSLYVDLKITIYTILTIIRGRGV